MKKLMIVAAAAAMVGGAYATCDLEAAAGCAEVYDVTMSLKTTKCVVRYIAAKAADKCGLGGSAAVCECYRDVVSKSVKGVIFSCLCSCTTDLAEGDLESTLQITPARWNMQCSTVVDGQLFWIASDKVVLNDLMTFTHLYRIGKTNQKVEAAGTFGPLAFAGFGTYDTSNNRVKTISGNVAGLWLATYDCAFAQTEDTSAADYCLAYSLCDAEQVADMVLTPAYGTFTVKYNSSKSKKLESGYKYLCNGTIVPKAVLSYDVIADGAEGTLFPYYCAQ